MKKILGIVLAFVMLVTVLAIIPAASDVAQEDGYYVYLDEGITFVYVAGGEEYEFPVAAKDLGVIPKFEDGSPADRSVEMYLNELLDKGQPKFLEDLMIALLNYGAAAQQYFGAAGTLVGTPVTDTAALEGADTPDIDVTDGAGIYMGASLLLTGTIQLRFYFSGTDVTTNYGKAINPDGKAYSYIDVPVMPYAMSDSVTVTVGDTTSVTYAPINYLKNKASDPTLSTMVASIYAYGVAAKAYKDHKHDFTYGDPIIIEPTCTETGSKTTKCFCGETKTEVTEALGHNHDKANDVIKQAYPCVEGTKTNPCTRCDYVKTEKIDATQAHVFDSNATDDDWFITKVNNEYHKTGYCGTCKLMQSQGVYTDYDSNVTNANTLLSAASKAVSGSATDIGGTNSLDKDKTKAYPKAEHPRLLLDSATVDSIRDQINGGDAELIKILADIADNANFWYYEIKDDKGEVVGKYDSSRNSANLGTSSKPTYQVFSPTGTHNYNPQILNSIMAKAFLYLYTGVDLYAKEATANILEYVNTLYLDEGVGDNCRYWGYAMFAAAIVYDWCYHGMTDTDRDNIVKAVRTMVGTPYSEGFMGYGAEYRMEVGFPPEKQYAVSGHGCEYQILRDYLAFSLAIYGDNNGKYNGWYEYVGNRVYNEYVPVRNSFYEAGMVPQGVSIYVGIRFTSDIWSAWLLQSSTGTNPYVNQDQVIRSIFSRVVDGQYYFFDEGDDKREISAWGQGELNRFVLAANISAYLYNDETAAAWASGTWNGNYSSWVYSDNVNAFRIIYRSNNDTVSNTGSRHEGLDLICYNGGFMNEIVAHSGWSSSDVSVLMKIGGYSAGNHDHGDAGSFQIYYKGILAGDTGFYNSYNSTHHSTYHQATIAHNSIVVYSGSTSYGQKTGMEISDAMPKSSWLSSSTKTATLTGVSYKYDASGKNPRYAYIAGDISPAYKSSANVTKADRRMLSVFNTGNADAPMYFFVYDRVTTSSNRQVAFLLHTAAEPTISGNTVTVDAGGYYISSKTPPQGKLVLQSVIGGTIGKIGGTNNNYVVNGSQVASSKSDEYWGRVEIKTASAKDHTMLNVMYVTDKGKTLSLPATGFSVGSVADGAAIGNTVAVFIKDSTNYSSNLTFTAPDTGAGTKVNYYVSGMADGDWTITCGSQTIYVHLDADDGGLLVFNTYAGKEVTITRGTGSTGGSSSDNELPWDEAK
ncbi:MAG: heparinase II/III family protein [Clostridia bacterium]|nr:heparinase II/III family protein [Clostridia bacterium]